MSICPNFAKSWVKHFKLFFSVFILVFALYFSYLFYRFIIFYAFFFNASKLSYYDSMWKSLFNTLKSGIFVKTFSSNVELGNAIFNSKSQFSFRSCVNSGNSASEPRFLWFCEFRRRASVPRSYSGRAKNVSFENIPVSLTTTP